MGNLNICEREGCNAVVKGYAFGVVQLTTQGDGKGTVTQMTLCPEDVKVVYQLLKSEVVDERKRAYDKPFNVEEYEREETVGSTDVDKMTVEQLAALLFQRTMKEAQRSIEGGSKSEG